MANSIPTHRKFIALILAASVTITGFTAAPARADEDVAKVLAGIALLGLIGAAVNDHKHSREKRDVYPGPRPVQPSPVRPLPPRVTKYDLPGGCMTSIWSRGQNRKILPMRCLKRNYTHTAGLPRSCYVELRNEHQSRRGYRPRCLKRQGYRIVGN